MDIEIDRIAHAVPPGAHAPPPRARLIPPPEDFARASPFLLLAEDWFSPPAGFPDHPHRGIQTVTIVLEGELEHRDHTGARGALGEGDIQWMTAGRGVVHSEMPGKRGVHSLQLWLNLPAAQKMAQASYRDQRAAETPARRGPGYEVPVYAGPHEGLGHGPAPLCPLTLLHVPLEGEKRVDLEVPPGHRAFLYVVSGPRRIQCDD